MFTFDFVIQIKIFNQKYTQTIFIMTISYRIDIKIFILKITFRKTIVECILIFVVVS